MVDPIKTDFVDLPGWDACDHKAAFAAFRDSARFLLSSPPTTRTGSARSESLLALSRLALSVRDQYEAKEARDFFEENFQPFALPADGLLTGYYEPVFKGSRTQSNQFNTPLHRRPADLMPVSAEEAKAAGFTPETSFARITEDGISFHLSRAEVMAGGLDGLGLELVWLKDPVDAYIIHIQGSARIELDDGAMVRLAFDGKSGHPYRSLGKILIERGIFTPETISMDGLMAYIRDLGREGQNVLALNPSYIFFKEVEEIEGQHVDHGPVAAARIPLQPLTSIAVDRQRHTFGLPFWIDTALPTSEGPTPFRQLVLAHDTGSAIKGAARADLFVGTGDAAGKLAGQLQQPTRFFVLLPQQDAGEVM